MTMTAHGHLWSEANGKTCEVIKVRPDWRNMKADELLEQLTKVRAKEWPRWDRREEGAPGPVVTVSRDPGGEGDSIAGIHPRENQLAKRAQALADLCMRGRRGVDPA